jgi:hypothetical protein
LTIFSDSDSLNCNVKLFAVSDQRQKLIGSVSFPIDWKSEPFIT